jgi:hypothetical protein
MRFGKLLSKPSAPTSVITGGSVFIFVRRATPVARDETPTGASHHTQIWPAGCMQTKVCTGQTVSLA